MNKIKRLLNFGFQSNVPFLLALICDEDKYFALSWAFWFIKININPFMKRSLKVQKDSQTIVCDEVLEDTNTEEVRDSLPDHQPRWDCQKDI